MLGHQEKAKIFGHKVPLYFWFVLSGGICDIIQAVIDYIISITYPPTWGERATVCWTLSYILSIWIRHYSHRLLVFGEYEGTYCSSLSRTYFTYSSSIVISMVTNHLLVNYLFLSHRVAWIVTMLWTGIYNYFMLKSSWRSAPEKSVDITSSV
jgi:putative flippase GtrA